MSYTCSPGIYSAAVTPIITFNLAVWAAQFPEFTGFVPEPTALMDSVIASAYIDLGSTGPMANNVPVMTQVWYLATAHIAQLMQGSSLQPAGATVGRIASASEGSVSVTLDMPEPNSALEGWWNQTKYGAMVYAMTAQFRVGFYVPPLLCGGVWPNVINPPVTVTYPWQN